MKLCGTVFYRLDGCCYHGVITIQVFTLGCMLENQPNGKSSSLKMFVTGLIWIKSVNCHSFAVC